jgi:site-specific DNA recombinase
VSSKEQEQGYSIPAQRELLRRYASQQGLEIVEEFSDAETAKTTGRPAFAATPSGWNML